MSIAFICWLLHLTEMYRKIIALLLSVTNILSQLLTKSNRRLYPPL